MFFDVFLNVLAVLGIIAVGAFIIVFLSDLLISIVDGSNGIFFRRAGNKKNEKKGNANRPKLLPPSQNPELNKPEEVAEEETFDGIDYEKAKKEEEELKKSTQTVEDERSRLIRERRREFEKTVEAKPAPAPAPVKEEVKIEEIEKSFEEVSRLAIAEIEKEETKKRTALEEQHKKEMEDLRKELEKSKVVAAPVAVAPVVVGSRDYIENKLEGLRNRLKQNEKEFSVNKKDFLPLKRVSDTLEGDKKKLRRKEALVAKQKVQLYGVNNYVDIDEEKAKKLTEDLDLLEGLRLSVKHCEEVMSANKDRYPILERSYNILKVNIENMKADIADLEGQIEILDAKEAKKTDKKDSDTKKD